MRGPRDYFALGNWNAVCYCCGHKYKASELKRHWQGYYVCDGCWEPRHSQDFVRGGKDDQTPPWTQVRPGNVFVPGAPTVGPIAQPGDYPIHDD